jgi:hypothetical protein
MLKTLGGPAFFVKHHVRGIGKAFLKIPAAREALPPGRTCRESPAVRNAAMF